MFTQDVIRNIPTFAMTTPTGWLYCKKERDLESKQRLMIYATLRSERRLQARVRDMDVLLGLKAEASEQGRFLLYDLMKEVVAEVQEKAQTKGVYLFYSSKPIPCLFKGNFNQLYHIMYYLLADIVEFIQDDSYIWVYTYTSLNKAFISIICTDNHFYDGSLKQPSSQYFDRLLLSKPSVNNKMGASLLLAETIMKMYGGQVDIEVLPQKHSKLTITLPTQYMQQE